MAEVWIDATTFQKPLMEITEVIAQKVKRVAPIPPMARTDVHVLIRQAMWTCKLLYYLNADERRKTDCFWKDTYTIAAAPLVRNMIDCLFNISFILQDPVVNGQWFRKSGLQRLKTAVDTDELRYGKRRDWREWLDRCHDAYSMSMRASEFTPAEVSAAHPWPILGQYVRSKKGIPRTAHQDFVKTFLLGPWREYSAMAHATFEGLAPVALYFVGDSIPADERRTLDEQHGQIMSTQLGRAATILLCITTDIQAKFQFKDEGARINERICEVWTALLPSFEIRELYDEHYRELMEETGIKPLKLSLIRRRSRAKRR